MEEVLGKNIECGMFDPKMKMLWTLEWGIDRKGGLGLGFCPLFLFSLFSLFSFDLDGHYWWAH